MSNPPPFKQVPPGHPLPPKPYVAGSHQMAMAPIQTNGVGTAALIMSIIGLVFPLFSVIALICGLIGIFSQPRGNAVAGIIVSLVTILLWVALWVFVLGGMVMACLGLAQLGPVIATHATMFEIQVEMVEFHEDNDHWPTLVEFEDKFGHRNDGWGNPFSLELDGQFAILVSDGPDGIPGTDDDIRHTRMDGDNLPEFQEGIDFEFPEEFDIPVPEMPEVPEMPGFEMPDLPDPPEIQIPQFPNNG